MPAYGTPAEFLGNYEIGDVLPISVQCTSSTGVATDATTGPACFIIQEDATAGTTPITGPSVALATMAKRTGTGLVAGLYFGTVTLSGGTYTADKSYIVQITATVGGVIQVFLQRFYTRRTSKHVDTTVIRAAIDGTDSGGTAVTNAVARKSQVTR